MSDKSPPTMTVNVIGSGVLGMTCALTLAKRGHRVAIVARDLPTDLTSTAWASPFAGGYWHSFIEDESNKREIGWDKTSFNHLWQIARDNPSVVQVIDTFEFFDAEPTGEQLSWFFKCGLTPEARRLSTEEVKQRRPNKLAGITYKTVSWNPAVYLPWLASQLAAHGVKTIRRHLSCIDEAFYSSDTIPKADVVVNASGLGAMSLVGVADPAVEPVRGQTVLVKLPTKATFSTLEGFDMYVISRPSTQGEPGREAILGGCYQPGNWDKSPDPVLGQRILKDALAVFPEMSTNGQMDGIEVLRHNVGLRPGRKGGPRLEKEVISLPTGGAHVPGRCKGEAKRMATVVHCYGISGAGYQASWGMAEEVADLVATA